MSMPSSPQAQPPAIFDARVKALQLDRAAAHYDTYAFLKARVSSDILDRLDDTPRQFEVALDLGCHDGRLGAALAASPKATSVTGLARCQAMARLADARGLSTQVMADETLGAAAQSLDLVVSALALHWVNDVPGMLVQIRAALKPDGLFVGALFGAGTLPELRTALMQAETELTGGAAPRVSPLPGLKDMAALLQRAGFALPVADRETVTVRYGTVGALLKDLRGMGEQAAFAAPMRRSLPRTVVARAAEIYQEQFADPDGRLRASFEIVHLSGWAPAPSQPKPLRPGSARASLADAVKSVRSKEAGSQRD